MIEEAAVCWMEAASVRRRARGGPRFLRLAVVARRLQQERRGVAWCDGGRTKRPGGTGHHGHASHRHRRGWRHRAAADRHHLQLAGAGRKEGAERVLALVVVAAIYSRLLVQANVERTDGRTDGVPTDALAV